jgi:hypothetical protein
VLGLAENCWGIRGDATILRSMAQLCKVQTLSASDHGLVHFGADEKVMPMVLPNIVDTWNDVFPTLGERLCDFEDCKDDAC